MDVIMKDRWKELPRVGGRAQFLLSPDPHQDLVSPTVY